MLDEALERVSPAVEAARGKVSGELVPKLAEALSAAAAVRQLSPRRRSAVRPRSRRRRVSWSCRRKRRRADG